MHNQTVSAPFVPVFHNAKSRANPKWPLYGPARVLQKRHGSNKDLWHWDCPKCWKNRNILEMLTKLLATEGRGGDGRFAVDSLIFGASECFWMKKNSKDRWVENSYGPSDNTMGKGQLQPTSRARHLGCIGTPNSKWRAKAVRTLHTQTSLAKKHVSWQIERN